MTLYRDKVPLHRDNLGQAHPAHLVRLTAAILDLVSSARRHHGQRHGDDSAVARMGRLRVRRNTLPETMLRRSNPNLRRDDPRGPGRLMGRRGSRCFATAQAGEVHSQDPGQRPRDPEPQPDRGVAPIRALGAGPPGLPHTHTAALKAAPPAGWLDATARLPTADPCSSDT